MRPARNVIVLAAILVAAGCTSGSGGGGEGRDGGMGGDTGPAGSGNATSTFSKSYGGPLHDEANVVLNTSDGGFMLFGTADNNGLNGGIFPTQGGDWWLQKLDADGNVERSRLFGEHALPANSRWRRARALPDGGVVLAGSQGVTQNITRADGRTELITVGRDIAVARLGPTGSVLWTVSYDSGGWQNYDYFAAAYEPAAASDTGWDVWPAADGGFFVAGTSIANLQDRLGLGFPCDDDEIDALAGPDCADRPAHVGGQFVHAFSIVVMRLNADGSLRWVRRLTDNAFRNGNFDDSGRREVSLGVLSPETQGELGVIVRTSADGGLVLARSIEGGILVHRLGADGSPRWRAAVDGILAPTTMVQTDDGFAIVGDRHAIKLDADGALLWQQDLSPNRLTRLVLNDAALSCESATSGRCYVVAVGTYDPDGFGEQLPRGVAYLLDQYGGVAASASTSGTYQAVISFTRIAPGAGNAFELTGVNSQYELSRLDLHLSLPATSSSFEFGNYRHGAEHGVASGHASDPLPELRADGGVLQLTSNSIRLQFFDAQCALLAQSNFDGSAGVERLWAAADIGAGRFILAGTQRDADGSPRVIAMRYDQGGDRIVWQHVIAPPAGRSVYFAHVYAAVDTRVSGVSDGGVVLSLGIFSDELTRGLLLKLNADGVPQWQVELPSPAKELHPAAAGGVFALVLEDETLVTQLSASGAVVWASRIKLPDTSARLTTMAPVAGGVILAGTAHSSSVTFARLYTDGTLGVAAEVQLHDLSPTAVLDDPHIVENSNGDYIVAMRESSLLTRAAGNAQLPYGQDNVFVMKLTFDEKPIWGRVYGGAFAEGVHGLSLRRDDIIAITGYSDSLGDGREAWLLKLSPDGLVAATGCQALLGSLPVDSLSRTQLLAGSMESVTGLTSTPANIVMFDASLPMRTPQDFVTARQCQGIASSGGVAPGSGATPGRSTQRLTVETLGQRGVITSLPAGISCGTGLDVCAADFARGSVVTLRADPERFVAWLSACEADSGGIQLTCVVTMNADRTVQADFRPPPPAGHFTLSFEIQGPGSVGAGDINCREDTQPLNCSHEYTEGARVVVRAFPEQNWVGSDYDATFSGWSGDEACASLGAETSGFVTVDHDVHCIARFRAPNLHLLRIFGSVGGEVTDDPPSTTGIHCREIFTGTCSRRHASTTTVPLVADPDFGYRFVGWGGDCASFGSATNIAVVVADNTTCTATFERATTPQTLTVFFSDGAPDRIIDSDPPGIHCFMGTGSDCSESYAPGTQVFLSSDYPGTDWIGCDRKFRPIDNGVWICRVDMDQQPRSASALFPPR